MKTCRNCGASNSDSDRFCGNCGAALPEGPSDSRSADASGSPGDPYAQQPAWGQQPPQSTYGQSQDPWSGQSKQGQQSSWGQQDQYGQSSGSYGQPGQYGQSQGQPDQYGQQQGAWGQAPYGQQGQPYGQGQQDAWNQQQTPYGQPAGNQPWYASGGDSAPAPAPKRGRSGWKTALLVIIGLILLFCVGLIVFAVTPYGSDQIERLGTWAVEESTRQAGSN